MTRVQHIAFGFLALWTLGSTIYLGVICQERPAYVPLPEPSYRPATPFLELQVDTPDPEETPFVVYIAPTPTPKPEPTYDDDPIYEEDYDDQDDVVCHYDRYGREGYRFYGSRQFVREHLTQHPNDYRANGDGPCDTLPSTDGDDDE